MLFISNVKIEVSLLRSSGCFDDFVFETLEIPELLLLTFSIRNFFVRDYALDKQIKLKINVVFCSLAFNYYIIFFLLSQSRFEMQNVFFIEIKSLIDVIAKQKTFNPIRLDGILINKRILTSIQISWFSLYFIEKFVISIQSM